MQRISLQLKMHLKTQLAVIENNSTASLARVARITFPTPQNAQLHIVLVAVLK